VYENGQGEGRSMSIVEEAAGFFVLLSAGSQAWLRPQE
jgi:hypothetical protein